VDVPLACRYPLIDRASYGPNAESSAPWGARFAETEPYALYPTVVYFAGSDDRLEITSQPVQDRARFGPVRPPVNCTGYCVTAQC
jgi:hypothetical protein